MTSNIYNLIGIIVCLGLAIFSLVIVFHEYQLTIGDDDD